MNLSVAFAAEALETDGHFSFDETTPLPAAVLALQDCDANERTPAYRRAFVGGYIFAIKCASNHENRVETLVFSEHEDGREGRLLLFPVPKKHGDTQDTLSNIRWYPERNEIGEVFVDRDIDRDDQSYCRREGRWQLEGGKATPQLIFWRETTDCEGKTGWTVLVGKR